MGSHKKARNIEKHTFFMRDLQPSLSGLLVDSSQRERVLRDYEGLCRKLPPGFFFRAENLDNLRWFVFEDDPKTLHIAGLRDLETQGCRYGRKFFSGDRAHEARNLADLLFFPFSDKSASHLHVDTRRFGYPCKANYEAEFDIPIEEPELSRFGLELLCVARLPFYFPEESYVDNPCLGFQAVLQVLPNSEGQEPMFDTLIFYSHGTPEPGLKEELFTEPSKKLVHLHDCKLKIRRGFDEYITSVQNRKQQIEKAYESILEYEQFYRKVPLVLLPWHSLYDELLSVSFRESGVEVDIGGDVTHRIYNLSPKKSSCSDYDPESDLDMCYGVQFDYLSHNHLCFTLLPNQQDEIPEFPNLTFKDLRRMGID